MLVNVVLDFFAGRSLVISESSEDELGDVHSLDLESEELKLLSSEVGWSGSFLFCDIWLLPLCLAIGRVSVTEVLVIGIISSYVADVNEPLVLYILVLVDWL